MSRQNPLLYAVMARWSAVNLKTHLLGDRLLSDRKRRPNGTFRMTRGGAMFEACEGFDT